MRLSRMTVWALALAMGTFVVGGPYLYYRYSYTYGKRLRPVVDGKVYRSGCMTADGLAAAIKARHIRTVFNLMEELPDPILSQGYLDLSPIREAEVCEQNGAKMVNLTVDLIAPNRLGRDQPAAIKTFLERMDDPASYPVLIHCKAGLHRTGIMVAVYRMEYCHWTAREALGELKANGFGDFAATAANEYITQYILTYEPRR